MWNGRNMDNTDAKSAGSARLGNLNDRQRAAAIAGDDPLLIIAGAGTGKTNTLAHRVAHLIQREVNPAQPGRILLLTFTRRASAEMLRRVDHLLSASGSKIGGASAKVWGGTFHAIANRLLRIHAKAIGLGEAFTVLDRSDSEDLLNLVRSDLNLESTDSRFPRKSACMSLYSRCVNANESIEQALKLFPWCAPAMEQLKVLFREYTQRKHAQNILDYDDLLLYWHALMHDPSAAAEIAGRFDHVLVDEYQDTNAIQAQILEKLSPQGRGLTVVGDDAQAIYSFRAATVRNILDFPQQFPAVQVIKLEENYRSRQPILDLANAVIAQSKRRHEKELFAARSKINISRDEDVIAQKALGERPRLVSVQDETAQSEYLVKRILERYEAGIALRQQAVLFRTAHHSDALELELTRRNIPFVKYGGLKFLEAAHIKDVMGILRVAENPRDNLSLMRTLLLVDGIGPATARKITDHLAARRFDLESLRDFPASAAAQLPALAALLQRITAADIPLADQLAAVRSFYKPILEKRYDQPAVRLRDIEQLERLSSNFPNRQAMLADLTLDPPAATADLAGPPLRDDDYLILSTIHSAKGCEWDAVYVLHAADGNIPSDMATGSDEEIEEERRLFYVALTRARDWLEVCFPLRYYQKKHSMGDRHTYAQLTRFLPENAVELMERITHGNGKSIEVEISKNLAGDIRKKLAARWG